MQPATRTTLAIAVGLLAAACGSAAPASAPAGLPSAAASTPAAWSGLEKTKPILGGSAFGGPGNQLVMSAIPFRGSFLAAGEDFYDESKPSNGVIWRSDDGSTWARIADPTGTFTDAVVEDLVTNGARVVAFGHDGHGAAEAHEWISDDGSTWHAAGPLPASTPQPVGVVAGNGSFLALGTAGAGAPSGTILRSGDGEHWTETSFATEFAGDVASGLAPYRGGWVATGSKEPDAGQPCCGGPTPPGLAWFSADGIKWSAAHIDARHSVGGPVPGSAGLIALGSGPLGCGGCVEAPNLWHSTDGVTWDLVGQQPMANIVYASDGSRIVRATSDQHTIDLAWSTEGLTWQPLATSLAFHNEYGPFVVGPQGILFVENPPNGTQTDAGIWYLPAR
jgi:hypothetical protein